MDAAQVYFEARKPVDFVNIELKPELVYLEVRTQEVSALMVLAQVDKTIDGDGVVETWISARREVLRTYRGFIAGSKAVSGLPEQVDFQFALDGTKRGLVFSQPEEGVYSASMDLLPLNVDSLNLKNTTLYQRARKVNGLVLNAWRGHIKEPVPRLKSWDQALFVVGTHPQTGKLIYAFHCLQPGKCIELLVRTAAQNL